MSRPWVLDMLWRDVCFAHWRADAARLERTLPPGVELDCYDGEAWLSVVPFRLTRIHARCTLVVPGFADVAEINLRTYVRVGTLRGIWFYSLDAASPLVVRSARAVTALPYFDARIVTTENAHGITYRSERTERGRTPGTFTARYRVPGLEYPITPATREAFLHERYWFFTLRGKQLVRGMIRHSPWTIGPTSIEITQNSLGDLIEHPLCAPPDYGYFARQQRVRAGLIERATA